MRARISEDAPMIVSIYSKAGLIIGGCQSGVYAYHHIKLRSMATAADFGAVRCSIIGRRRLFGSTLLTAGGSMV